MDAPVTESLVANANIGGCNNGMCGDGSCTDGCCGDMGCCDEGCCGDCCCRNVAKHRCRIFGEYLFLAAGNVDYRYGLPVNGTTATATPQGAGGLVQTEHESGYRFGGAFAFDDCSSLVLTYWNLDTDAADSLTLPGGGGNFIRALAVHPNTRQVDTDSLSASANYSIDFEMLDADYQILLAGNCDWALNARGGIRWASLEQTFAGQYTINGTTSVLSDVDFDGVGPRFGLDYEHMIGGCGISFYATSSTSFLFGDYKARYLQRNVFAGTQAADGLTDYRMTPVFELESGLRWTSCSGCFSMGAGYFWSAWFNTMTNPTWIEGVQTADYDNIDETLLFDGLTLRAEIRF